MAKPTEESEKKGQTEYTLQNAMDKLAELLKNISEDIGEIYLKPPSQIDESLLKTISLSFTGLLVLFQEFWTQWFDSTSSGPDAIVKSANLEERIDIKLYQTKKLDFVQLKKIMIRMSRLDDALMGLDRVSFLLRYYEDACKAKRLTKYSDLSELFRVYSIDQLREILRTEAKRLGNQIERCNLYYQADTNTQSLSVKKSALRVAYVALAISVMSILLTIILNAI